jgi:hypothetical protein
LGSVGMCIRLRQHAAGNDNPGWGPAMWDLRTDLELNREDMAPYKDASMVIVRAKKPGETFCSI